MAVKTIKKWETVYFIAEKRGYRTATVELTFNHQDNSFTLNTEHEESVSFKGDGIVRAKMKVTALQQAMKYIEKILENNQ